MIEWRIPPFIFSSQSSWRSILSVQGEICPYSIGFLYLECSLIEQFLNKILNTFFDVYNHHILFFPRIVSREVLDVFKPQLRFDDRGLILAFSRIPDCYKAQILLSLVVIEIVGGRDEEGAV